MNIAVSAVGKQNPSTVIINLTLYKITHHNNKSYASMNNMVTAMIMPGDDDCRLLTLSQPKYITFRINYYFRTTTTHNLNTL